MKKIMYVICFVFTALNLYGEVNCEEYPRPIAGERIHDFYNQISVSDKAYLRPLLFRYEDSTGIQMAVVTVANLGGKDEFTYAQELSNCWGVGESGVDNGIVLIISLQDSTWRIHTGAKMEIYLTDADANQIGEEVLVPIFLNGEPSRAIRATVDAIIQKVGWESWEERERAQALAAQQQAEKMRNFFSGFLQFLLLGGAGFFIFLLIRNSRIRKRVRAVIEESDKKMREYKKEVNTTDWPNWAKKQYEQSLKDLEPLLPKYEKKKEELLQALKKDPKKVESEEFPGLKKMQDEVMNLLHVAHQLPMEIRTYIQNAPGFTESLRDNIAAQLNQVRVHIQKGFRINSTEEALMSKMETLNWFLSEMQKNTNRDVFKEAYEKAVQFGKEYEEQKSSVYSLIKNHATVNTECPLQRTRIGVLRDEPLKNAFATIELMKKTYPESVYKTLNAGLKSVDELLSRADAQLVDALTLNTLELQKFEDAYQKYTNALKDVNSVQDLYTLVSTTLSEQRKEQEAYPKIEAHVTDMLIRVGKECQHADVSAETKKKYEAISEKYVARVELTKEKLIDWHDLTVKMEELHTEAKAILIKAQAEIAAAKKKREDAADDDDNTYGGSYRPSVYRPSTSYTPSPTRSYGGGTFKGGGAGGSLRRWESHQ